MGWFSTAPSPDAPAPAADPSPPDAEAPAERVVPGPRPSTKRNSHRESSASRNSNMPCEPERAASLRCLAVCGNEEDRCQAFFDAYRTCMNEWREARRRAMRGEGS
mmetsp:Transcript_6478/g.15714  ORF Transcript_6478/g.15714 Transcript_6478/m.15714 type:complete len:106 (-) Transcript_6478:217-534(-)